MIHVLWTPEHHPSESLAPRHRALDPSWEHVPHARVGDGGSASMVIVPGVQGLGGSAAGALPGGPAGVVVAVHHGSISGEVGQHALPMVHAVDEPMSEEHVAQHPLRSWDFEAPLP